jgi:hypothetical protein
VNWLKLPTPKSPRAKRRHTTSKPPPIIPAKTLPKQAIVGNLSGVRSSNNAILFTVEIVDSTFLELIPEDEITATFTWLGGLNAFPRS